MHNKTMNSMKEHPVLYIFTGIIGAVLTTWVSMSSASVNYVNDEVKKVKEYIDLGSTATKKQMETQNTALKNQMIEQNNAIKTQVNDIKESVKKTEDRVYQIWLQIKQKT